MKILWILIFLINSSLFFNPEDILTTKKYQAVIPALNWLHDDSFLVAINESQSIQRWYPFSDKDKEYMYISKDCNYLKAKLSPNKLWISFPCNTTKKFRHSSESHYMFLYYDGNGNYIDFKHPFLNSLPIQYFLWVGQNESLAFVKNNNIYYCKNFISGYHQLTFDGEEGIIFNGVADWIYEEEIFGKSGSIVDNKQGKIIIYTRIDDSKVNTIDIPVFDGDNISYPKKSTLRYSRVNMQNPKLKLFACFINFDNIIGGVDRHIELKPPPQIKEHDSIIAFFKLSESNQVIVGWMNRKQNRLLIYIYDLEKWFLLSPHNRKIFEYKTNGWVEERIINGLMVSPYNDMIYLMFPTYSSKNNDSFIHVNRINYTKVNKIDSLTSGNWEIYEMLCVNDRYLYYISNEQGYASRHLYRLDLVTSIIECLTCKLIKQNCNVFEVKMSPSCKIGYVICLGPRVPLSTIYMFEPRANTTVDEISMEKNVELEKRMNEEKPFITKIKEIKFNPSVYIRLKYPSEMSSNYSRKDKPFLIDIYGGPGYNVVLDTFNMAFDDYFSYKYKTISVSADVRGSYGLGLIYRFSVKNKLGLNEADDLAKLIRGFKKSNFKKSKFCVKGWSYGGFLALMLMKKYPDLIDCVISIAPVVDWRYYDSFYTERYMGYPTPEDNLHGYENTSLLRNITSFKNKNIFIAQGTSDDNVHFQNTEDFVYRMIYEGINVEYMVFPYMDHSISGTNARNILYKKIETFLINNLVN